MQTRRDQLQAYKFQNRRALAALITGEPNLVDPPMRRLTITTISGIMIAVLITVGFTVFGLIRPKAGDSWKEPGSIIIEQDTGATFVYLENVLHPVVNYTSAVLAVGQQNAHVVEVDRADIADANRGVQIGIPGLPSSLPDPGGLVTKPIAVCSRLQPNGDSLDLRVSVLLGVDPLARAARAGQAVLVNTGPGSQSYLLFDGHRLAIGGGNTPTSLGLTDQRPLQVGRAFLDAIPPGSDLKAPNVQKRGFPVRYGTVAAVVGQLLDADGDAYVVMSDGVARVNPLQEALLRALPLGPSNTPLDPVKTSSGAALGLPRSQQWAAVVSEQLNDLPADVPELDVRAADDGGLCAQFTDGSDQPTFAIPPSQLPSFQTRGVTESTASKQGRADRVTLPPGRAAMVKSADGAATVFIVGDIGRKFAAQSAEVLSGFRYDAKNATELPAGLLSLIPSGRALDPQAARSPVTD